MVKLYSIIKVFLKCIYARLTNNQFHKFVNHLFAVVIVSKLSANSAFLNMNNNINPKAFLIKIHQKLSFRLFK